MIKDLRNQLGALGFALLVLLLAGGAIWAVFVMAANQVWVNNIVNLTHGWLNLLIRFSKWISFGWLVDSLRDWKASLPSEILVGSGINVPKTMVFEIWFVWVVTLVAIWLIWMGITALLGMRIAGADAGGEGRSGGGGGITRTADGKWAIVNSWPVYLFLFCIIVVLLGPQVDDVVWDRVDEYQERQTYSDRLEADGQNCVPDTGNIIDFDAVEYCVGIWDGSTVPEKAKQAQTITLQATCNAFDYYANHSQSTPTWRVENDLRDRTEYGEKAQWMADQGVPCSIKATVPKDYTPLVAFVVFVFIVPVTAVTIGLLRKPATDGAGTNLPFSGQRNAWVIRSTTLILVALTIYVIAALIF